MRKSFSIFLGDKISKERQDIGRPIPATQEVHESQAIVGFQKQRKQEMKKVLIRFAFNTLYIENTERNADAFGHKDMQLINPTKYKSVV